MMTTYRQMWPRESTGKLINPWPVLLDHYNGWSKGIEGGVIAVDKKPVLGASFERQLNHHRCQSARLLSG